MRKAPSTKWRYSPLREGANANEDENKAVTRSANRQNMVIVSTGKTDSF